MKSLNINKIGTGRPLIFIHGWGFNANIWFDLSHYLKDKFELWFIDLPGYGHSDYLTYDQSGFIEHLLAHLPEQFTLVGWSLGGLISNIIAIKYPQRVDKLVLVASTPCFIGSKEWPGMSPEVFQHFDHRLRLDIYSTLTEFVYLNLPINRTDKHLIKALKNELKAQSVSLQTLMDGLMALANWDIRDQIINIRSCQLYLLGELDRLVPSAVAANLKKLSSRVRTHIFQGQGHIPFKSDLESFIKILTEYLNE